MQLIFEWVEADRGCIMLLDEQTKALTPKVRRNRHGFMLDREVGHQQDDSRLRARAQRRRVDERCARRRSLGHGREHRANGDSRGDLRAHARALRRGGSDLHRHVDQPSAHRAAKLSAEQVHRRAFEIDDRHRSSGGAGGGRHALLFGHDAGRAPGGRWANDRHAVASHQEHTARHQRRQLSDREGLWPSTTRTSCARAGTWSSATKARSRPW